MFRGSSPEPRFHGEAIFLRNFKLRNLTQSYLEGLSYKFENNSCSSIS